MTGIAVACQAMPGGWSCTVTLDEGESVTRHSVSVTRADLARLDPGASEPTRLVRGSFEFLLEREPKESILRQFGLPEIGRYFPEYEGAIAAHLNSND